MFSLCFRVFIIIAYATRNAAEKQMLKSAVRGMLGAWKQTIYEQNVEDTNAVYKFNNYLDRRLIALPIQSNNSPISSGLMQGKEKNSDKCSLPHSIGAILYEKLYEMPWTFEIAKNKQATGRLRNADTDMDTLSADNTTLANGEVGRVYASALDFRAPENYIFIPPWMMRSLGLKSYDIVDLKFLKLHGVSGVTLQPLTRDWVGVMREVGDLAQGMLEQEINRFSTLTAGTTIAVTIKGRELPLYVKETKSTGLGGREIAVGGVCIQDSDMRTVIDMSRIPGHDDIGTEQGRRNTVEKCISTDDIANSKQFNYTYNTIQ